MRKLTNKWSYKDICVLYMNSNKLVKFRNMKKKVLMIMLALVISVTACAQCTVYLIKDGEHGDYTAKPVGGKFDQIDAQAAEAIGNILRRSYGGELESTIHLVFEGANEGTKDLPCSMTKSKNGGRNHYYSKAICKCTFKNAGETMISTLVKVDGKWTKGPNITLNLENGETYFVRIQNGTYNLEYKELTEKEYLKAAKKIKNVFEYD